MIQLQARELPASAASALRALQAEIDDLPTYADRVAAVPRRFKNAAKSKAFADVKQTLESMSAGNSRCMLCEDSAANEIDHLKPKSLYPELTFSWPNYISSCGLCNRIKAGKFAVFSAQNGELVDVTRRVGAPIMPPLEGESALIHPRYEDATRLLGLDIRDSFYFYPLALPGTNDHRRAQYTIKMLKLNARDPLVRQRRQYFELYAGQVEAYLHAKTHGAADADLADRLQRVRALGHPTVWHEMRRQHGRLPRLQSLFASLPEALLWDSAASATNRWPYGE